MAKKDVPAVVEKPRVRVGAWRTKDGFQNFAASLGIGTDNQFSAGTYGFNFITRNRTMLEAAYRTSWLVRAAVDIPAEDMTSAGISLSSSLKPDETQNMNAAIRDLMLPQSMSNGVRWGLLFGGAIGVLLIDGQRLDTPLRMDTVRKDSFRGIMVLDRWRVQPAGTEIITTLGPDIGLPKFYMTVDDNQALSGTKIHHTRCIRFIGDELPYYQSLTEQRWGASRIEGIWDRLLAFDSTSQGIAQLVFKAHLRTLKIENLRDLIAAGGEMYEAMTEQIALIRRYQNAEGLTLLDASDEFQVDSYTFAGLSDISTSQGEQLSGALEIPMTRLFGQAPAGLNTDGDSALSTYYDGNTRKQETKLRRGWTMVLDVLCRSVTGKPPPPGFSFEFNPLGQMSPAERAEMADNVESAVSDAYDKGIISQKIALQELKNSSKATGIFSSITDDDIADAEDTLPDASEIMPGVDPVTGKALVPGQATENTGAPKPAADGKVKPAPKPAAD